MGTLVRDSNQYPGQPTPGQPAYGQPGPSQPGPPPGYGPYPQYNPNGYPGHPGPPGYQPTPGYPAPGYPGPVSSKTRLAAGLLGIFLGSLGIHNFYLGRTNLGVTQLLIAIFTCGVGAEGAALEHRRGRILSNLSRCFRLSRHYTAKPLRRN